MNPFFYVAISWEIIVVKNGIAEIWQAGKLGKTNKQTKLVRLSGPSFHRTLKAPRWRWAVIYKQQQQQQIISSGGGRENPPTAPSVFNHSKAKDQPVVMLSLWTLKTNGL